MLVRRGDVRKIVSGGQDRRPGLAHGRYVTFHLAEVAVPRNLFRDILRRIDQLLGACPGNGLNEGTNEPGGMLIMGCEAYSQSSCLRLASVG